MRILIQPHGQGNAREQRAPETFYLLENIGHFDKSQPYGGDTWLVEAVLNDAVQNRVVLAKDVEDNAVTEAMDTLLRLIADRGEGTAVILWNGRAFTKRTL